MVETTRSREYDHNQQLLTISLMVAVLIGRPTTIDTNAEYVRLNPTVVRQHRKMRILRGATRS